MNTADQLSVDHLAIEDLDKIEDDKQHRASQ